MMGIKQADLLASIASNTTDDNIDVFSVNNKNSDYIIIQRTMISDETEVWISDTIDELNEFMEKNLLYFLGKMQIEIDYVEDFLKYDDESISISDPGMEIYIKINKGIGEKIFNFALNICKRMHELVKKDKNTVMVVGSNLILQKNQDYIIVKTEYNK